MRRQIGAAYDRSYNPGGAGLQMLAMVASGDRAAGLKALGMPTVVIHGDRDPLIDVSGGRRTAELVPGAELIELEGMGHDLPTYFWPVVVESVDEAGGAGRHRRAGRDMSGPLAGPLRVRIIEIAGIGPGPVLRHAALRPGRRRGAGRPAPSVRRQPDAPPSDVIAARAAARSRST